MVHEQSKKNECTCICQTLFPSYKLHIALYTSVLPHIKFMRTITNMHASYCAANLTVLCTETLCVCESMCVCVCVCVCVCERPRMCTHITTYSDSRDNYNLINYYHHHNQTVYAHIHFHTSS